MYPRRKYLGWRSSSYCTRYDYPSGDRRDEGERWGAVGLKSGDSWLTTIEGAYGTLLPRPNHFRHSPIFIFLVFSFSLPFFRTRLSLIGNRASFWPFVDPKFSTYLRIIRNRSRSECAYVFVHSRDFTSARSDIVETRMIFSRFSPFYPRKPARSFF